MPQISPQTRRVFFLSLPIFAELLLQLLVGNMDQFMISHFGAAAVASIGNGNQVMNVVVIVLFCIIPMVAWIATLIAMRKYSLTGERMKEIQAINAARKAAIDQGMSLEEAMERYQTIDQVPQQLQN